jgi:hypothetical protein
MVNYSIEEILKILGKLEKEDFYGKATLVFEKGKIRYIKKEETIMKPKSGG